MKKKASIPFDESFEIGILLAVVGGFLDAYTYLLRGGVFANAQTGNMVLLGIQFAKGNIRQCLYYFIPISAFAAGVFVTEYLKRNYAAKAFFRWQHIILLIEAVTLFFLGWLPLRVPNAIINVAISFICSLQVCSFKTLIDTPYATTMCTGNLRSALEHLFRFFTEYDRKAGKKALHYLIIILCFCLGASLGTWLAGIWYEKAVWFCSAILLLVLSLMMIDSKLQKRHTSSNWFREQ